MYGSRIRIAREICCMSQQELGEKIGTSQAGVASLESGRYRPSSEFLEKISMATGFGFNFFELGELPELSAGSLLYRSQASIKPSVKTHAHAHCLVAFDLALRLSNKLKAIPVNIPRLSDRDPAQCARLMRASLGLSPSTPIKNLIRTLEKSGVFVFGIPMEAEGLDGFSAWAGSKNERPVIALLEGKFGYRQHFTTSEELGHLAMHHPLNISQEDADKEARLFAQEFLLPAEAMDLEMPRPVTLSGLSEMKPRWMVSIQLLVMRAEALGFTTPNQSRYLWQQISSRGWRKREPGDDIVQQESPRMLRAMAEVLYGTPLNMSKLSKDHGLPSKQIRSLFGVLDTPSRVLSFSGKKTI